LFLQNNSLQSKPRQTSSERMRTILR